MPTHRIAHYNFRLNRALLAELVDFYVRVVGLAVGPRPAFRSFGVWLYADGEDLLHLTEEAPGDERRTGTASTFDHVAFECSDWPAFEARLIGNGIDFDIDHVPDTGVRQVFFRDPAGNGVELIFKHGDGPRP